MERIYPSNRQVPSWSWMAYDGAIAYMNFPSERVAWNNKVQPFTNKEHGRSNYEQQNDDNAPNIDLKAPAREFPMHEMEKERQRLIFDGQNIIDI